MSPIVLARLLQLSSQALPIGGYSHSQGLEAAIDQRVVTDEDSLLRWISDVLEFSMKSFEIPSMRSMAAAWARNDPAALAALNQEFLSARESAEIRAAAVQMGFSLRALPCKSCRISLQIAPPDALGVPIREPSLPCVWSATTTAWEIEPQEAVIGYLLGRWAENQVLVAIESRAHRSIRRDSGSLLAIGSKIAELAARMDLGEVAWREMDLSVMGTGEMGGAGASEGLWSGSNFCPGLAILSSQHETQYSRLFRS